MDTNLAYVAGLIDGEGCIHLDVTKGRWYQPRVSVGMTEPALHLLKGRMKAMNKKGPRAAVMNVEAA